METLSWVAATQAMHDASGYRPKAVFCRGMPEVGIGFAIAETDPVPLLITAPVADVA
jgi:hypothetical protein